MVVYRDFFQALAVFHKFKSFTLTFSFNVACSVIFSQYPNLHNSYVNCFIDSFNCKRDASSAYHVPLMHRYLTFHMQDSGQYSNNTEEALCLTAFETVFQSISGPSPKEGWGGGERRKKIELDKSKNVQTIPTRTYCKRNRPLPILHPKSRMPRHWKLTQAHHTTQPPPNIDIHIS